MLARLRMRRREVILVFNQLHGQAVRVICFLGFQRRQVLAAAADLRLRRGGQHIAAVRTDIEFRSLHISSLSVIFVHIAFEQLFEPHAERLRQPRQEGHIRQPQPALPLADGLVDNHELIRQFQLGQAAFDAQAADKLPCFLLIHGDVPPCCLMARFRIA